MGFSRLHRTAFAAVAVLGLGSACVAPQESTGSKLLTEGKPVSDVAAPLSVPNNVPPANDTGVSKVVSSVQHNCAIRSGSLACWGLNKDGQIGNGEAGVQVGVRDLVSGSADTPRVVVSPHTIFADRVSDVALGYEHTCAIRGGDLLCWGSNSHGQLGLGADVAGSAVPVSILRNAKQVVARGRWTCAVSDSGQLVCFGTRLARSGADLAPLVVSKTPKMILDSGVRSVAISANHACAIVAGGALKCFGMNVMGEVGNGLLDGGDVADPVDVLSGGVSAISLTDGRSMAVQNGKLVAFGASLGDRDVDRAAGGWKVPTASPYDAVFWNGIGPGLQASASGTVLSSAGDLFYGSYFHSNGVAPKVAIGVSQFSYSEADLAGCMMFRNHAVKCWGQNIYGQLGGGKRSAEEILIFKSRDVQF